MLKPDELSYLEASRRCGECDHLEALHWANQDGDAGPYCPCEVPECGCRDFKEPEAAIPVGILWWTP